MISFDDGLAIRLHLCRDHPSASVRVGAAEGNGSPLRKMSLPLAPLSLHLPSEWSLVRRGLGALLPRSRLDGTHRNLPIAEGCDTFESCIASSRQHALKIDIDALETVGKAQLALGRGLDSNVMSEHMSLIRRVGLRAALHEMSSTLLDRTLQPRTPFLDTPPPRLPPLPISPHPSMVPVISPLEAELISEHQLLAVPVQRDTPEDITEMSSETVETLKPYVEGMSIDKKLHLLATHGGQFLVANDFRPNGGLGVVPYPPSVAPMATVEAHMGINQRKGRIIILPLSFARQQCERAGLAFHVSNVSIANKPDAKQAIGCLISDYSH